MTPSLTVGRSAIILGNLLYSIGAFVFDYNETHVLNPRWPPHAKFHNGQTMTLGTLLCVLSLYHLFRSTSSPTQRKDHVWNASVVGSLYCLAGLSAILYPDTAWQESVSPLFHTSLHSCHAGIDCL
jgi:hypothetical protein